MSKQDLLGENPESTEFLQTSEKHTDASFTIDEHYADAAESEGHYSEHEVQASGKTDNPSLSTEVESAGRTAEVYQPRRHTPSHILFLPNLASRTSEKELAEFAEQLPCKVRKTFVYMSDVAYHGFVECESVDDASKNLDFINSHSLEIRGKRVCAEFSRRKNVQDRRTYENRQHVRKERDSGYDRRPRDSRGPPPPPLRRRSRSRSPPRGYRPRSPPRTGPLPRGRYPPPPRDYRDDHYRREGPPPSDYRHPPRSYEGPPPAPYRRDYERDREYRRDYDRYDSYPPRGGYPADSYNDSYRPTSAPSGRGEAPYREGHREVYSHPAAAPSGSYQQQQPRVAFSAQPVGPSDHYPQPYQQPSNYASAPAAVSHPLLSMRPTTIGTAPAAYQYHQYR